MSSAPISATVTAAEVPAEQPLGASGVDGRLNGEVLRHAYLFDRCFQQGVIPSWYVGVDDKTPYVLGVQDDSIFTGFIGIDLDLHLDVGVDTDVEDLPVRRTRYRSTPRYRRCGWGPRC